MDHPQMTPGQLLLLILNGYGQSQADLALLMKRPAQMVSEIVHGKKRITAATALDLEEATGVPARVWLLMQSETDLQSRYAHHG